MKYEKALQKGKLLQRYKRFLADIETDEGQMTIHCPNTGSMKNCAEPGFDVWFSKSDNKKRKYAHTWELAGTHQGHFIGINTLNANRLVAEAIESGTISELIGYETLQKEVKYGSENSRIDFLLTDAKKADCYVEVKSVTLLEKERDKEGEKEEKEKEKEKEKEAVSGQGYFPDAVSERGQKHLRELAIMATEGHRAVLLFCVQHTGIQKVTTAKEIDPAYDLALREARKAGVEVFAYGCEMSPTEINITHAIPFHLD